MSGRLTRVALSGLVGAVLAVVPVVAAAAPGPTAPSTGRPPVPTGMTGMPSTADQPGPAAPSPTTPTLTASALMNPVAGLLDTGRRRGVTTLWKDEWVGNGPPSGFTGSIAGCVPGTTSAAFRAAVIDRVNAYRRLAGSPADITENAAFSTQAQAAALMMAANKTLSHSPPTTWTCFSSTGQAAAGSSDLFLGVSDLQTVDGYVWDFAANNTEAGHRWWVLRPSGTQMGVGSTDGPNWYDKANALYVNDGVWTARAVRSLDGTLSWPSPGFLPYQLVPMRWTFLVPGGDYSAASVSMSINGKAQPVTVDVRGGSFGQVVFHRTSQDVNAWTQMATPATDQVVRVTIGGVRVGGVAKTYSYTTVVYDPANPKNIYRGDLAATATTPVQVTGRGGVAAGATGAFLNVTVTNPGASGYLTVWPCSAARPVASTINFTAGRTIANAALTSLDASGQVCVYTSATTDVVIDVGGQASPGLTDEYQPLTARRRVLDTRTATGGGELVRGTVREVPLAGVVAAVPADSTGVVVNVTTVGATSGGYLTVYPCGQARPVASTVNTRTTGAISNSATVKLSATGSLCLYGNQDTHVVLDVQGAIVPSASPGSLVTTMTPKRILDTRVAGSGGALSRLVTRRIQVTGTSGMPSAASAVVANLTVVSPSGNGWLVAWPCGARPTASNINYLKAEVIAGQATVGLDSGGGFCLQSLSSTNVVVDVTGSYGVTGWGLGTLTPSRLVDTRTD